MLSRASEAVNILMSSTEVEVLVDDPTLLHTGPPEFEKNDPIDDWHRARYRLLAGL